jgi:hypothetical protein
MPFDLPLHKMNLAEKLQAMEMLWEDLQRSAERFPSPDWHREVLEEREKCVREGSMAFEDWDCVKRELFETADF